MLAAPLILGGVAYGAFVGISPSTPRSAPSVSPAARTAVRLYSVRVSPTRRKVSPGNATRAGVRVVRSGGFRGGVKLRVHHVPRGMRASIRRGVLRVLTPRGQRLGSYRLVIEGTSHFRGRRLRRSATLMLTVAPAERFTITGGPSRPLFPGSSAPIDLRLRNPRPVSVRMTSLRVRLRSPTTRPGCSGSADYTVTQYSGPYPLVLRPGRTSLSALVSEPSLWPRISMRNLSRNQDACHGAVVGLDYTMRVER